jgi:hypothetical protein
MRRTLVIALLALASFGAGYKIAFDYQEQRRQECGAAWYQTMGALRLALERIDTLTATPCAEDDPCWDCATMGNRICGEE